MKADENRRILVIDDNEAIHEDFRKILEKPGQSSTALADAKAAFLGSEAVPVTEQPDGFEIISGFQGQEGYDLVRASIAQKEPFAMAFVDVRMPPGWDGIETIEHIWKVDPGLQVVICTAFADYSWDQMVRKLGRSDKLLILKKPFEPIEICQLASALTAKWNAAQHEQHLISELTAAELTARAYAASLQTMNSALETAKATADKASELKTQFLVHLSDEIHRNLDGILGSIDNLRAPDDASETKLEHLDVILGASHHMIRAIDQILDFTMIESGQVQVEISTCSPLTIAEGVAHDLGDFAREKSLSLQVDVAGPIPETIQTDESRLREIIYNLVQNAIRFTEEGSVRIQLDTVQTDDWNRPNLRFQIIDTGIGVPLEHQGNLFEPFFRLRDPGGGEAAGTGLGLTLAKRLARLLGAEISIGSLPDQGSTFTLTLRVSTAPASSPADVALPATPRRRGGEA